MKGTCTRSTCEYWHLPECQFYKKDTECKAGDKCLFPHHEVDEQPNKKPNKGHYSHKRRESEDKNAVAIVKMYHNWIGSRKTQKHWFLKEENSSSETRCKKFWDELEEYERITQSTLRQASFREKKGPWFGKVQVKNLHQRSPHVMKFWHWSHEKTERDNSDAPEARRGTLPKTFTSSKRMTKRHSTRRGRMCTYSRLHQQKSRSKESLWWILERVCTWSVEETLTLLSWRPWGHREVQRRWWRPTARCKQEKKQCLKKKKKKATVYVKELDLFVTVMLLEETPSVLSLGKLCEDHRYTYHWTSGQKITSHQTWQENWLQNIKLCTIRSPSFVSEFLHHSHSYFFIIFITGFRFWRQQIHRKSSTRTKWKYEWGAAVKPAA